MPETDSTKYDLPSDRVDNSKLNKLRAAVLGANDGIVSISSVVMGVAGATSDSQAISAAGLAALIAGALSMAVGEPSISKGIIFSNALIDTTFCVPKIGIKKVFNIRKRPSANPGIAANQNSWSSLN